MGDFEGVTVGCLGADEGLLLGRHDGLLDTVYVGCIVEGIKDGS